jgi:aminopeptidase N
MTGVLLLLLLLCRWLLPQATFVVELQAPSHLAVLSNSPSASTHWVIGDSGDSVACTTFLPTPPMSTYLLSFAVGQFKSVTASTSR